MVANCTRHVMRWGGGGGGKVVHPSGQVPPKNVLAYYCIIQSIFCSWNCRGQLKYWRLDWHSLCQYELIWKRNSFLSCRWFPNVYPTIYLPKWKYWIMVIPILMHFCSFVSNWSVASCIKPYVIRGNHCGHTTTAVCGSSPTQVL